MFRNQSLYRITLRSYRFGILNRSYFEQNVIELNIFLCKHNLSKIKKNKL